MLKKFRLKTLHVFVLKAFLGPLALTFLIVTFLLQMQFLWKYIDDLVGKGLTFVIVGKLLLYATATFVPLSLPLAVLLASLMTFGSMGENYELTAIKSAGISLTRTLRPLVILMIAVSISAFYYSNFSMPFFNMKMRALLFDIQQQRPELSIKEGIFYNGIDNYSIRIGKKDSKTNLLYNLQLYDHTANQGNVNVTLADSGFMVMTADKHTLVITLFKGESYVDMADNYNYDFNKRTFPFHRDKFSKQIINIPLEGFNFQRTDEGLFRSNYQMMNLKQLKFTIDSMYSELYRDRILLKNTLLSTSLNHNPTFNNFKPVEKNVKAKVDMNVIFYMLNNNEQESILSSAVSNARQVKANISNETQINDSKTKRLRRHEIEWHKKFTLSLACIVFFFIGAPLGAIIRKGGLGLPIVIAVLFFILYYIITLSGEKIVRESYVPPLVGVWISSFILLPLGAFLTIKATNDSSFLNLESYYKVFNKIKGWGVWEKLFPKK